MEVGEIASLKGSQGGKKLAPQIRHSWANHQPHLTTTKKPSHRTSAGRDAAV